MLPWRICLSIFVCLLVLSSEISGAESYKGHNVRRLNETGAKTFLPESTNTTTTTRGTASSTFTFTTDLLPAMTIEDFIDALSIRVGVPKNDITVVSQSESKPRRFVAEATQGIILTVRFRGPYAESGARTLLMLSNEELQDIGVQTVRSESELAETNHTRTKSMPAHNGGGPVPNAPSNRTRTKSMPAHNGGGPVPNAPSNRTRTKSMPAHNGGGPVPNAPSNRTRTKSMPAQSDSSTRDNSLPSPMPHDPSVPLTFVVELLPGVTVKEFIGMLAPRVGVQKSDIIIVSHSESENRLFVEAEVTTAANGITLTIRFQGSNAENGARTLLGLSNDELNQIGVKSVWPANQNSPTAAPEENGSVYTSIIIVSVVCGVILLLVLGLTCYCCCINKKKKKEAELDAEDHDGDVVDEAHAVEMGEFTAIPPANHSNYNANAENSNNYSDVDAEYWGYNPHSSNRNNNSTERANSSPRDGSGDEHMGSASRHSTDRVDRVDVNRNILDDRINNNQHTNNNEYRGNAIVNIEQEYDVHSDREGGTPMHGNNFFN